MKQIVMAITGASGAAYARRLIECLVNAEAQVHLVVSPYGKRLLADELDIRRIDAESLIGRATDRITIYPYNDVGARIASGSFLTDGMVVCPCSSNMLGALAAGLGDNLISRAGAVTLKEYRRLIVVPREMPLSPIEVDNIARLTRAGAIVCPASPGFYLRPQTIEEIVDFVVGKVLDLLGIPHELHTRWQPPATAEE